MKRIYLLFFTILFFSMSALAASFVEGFEDIPLINGFNQLQNQDFSFGNEETGYTEATIVSSKKQSFYNVKTFYKQSLAELGWQLNEENPTNILFIRENNILEFSLVGRKPIKVRISLKSKN